MSDVLRVVRDGPITELTLARAEKANALDAALVEALIEALDRAADDGTRLLVLAGDGRNFCAGFDFTGFEAASDGRLVLRFIRIEQLLQKLWHAPFATAAFAHGRNFGAGVDLLVACDTRVAAPGSTFRMPGLAFGLQLGTRRLAARIGAERARDLLGASRTVDAERALAIGLASALAPASDWSALRARAAADATVLAPDAMRRLRGALAADTRAVDLADLVESVTVPGLKERIARYRAG